VAYQVVLSRPGTKVLYVSGYTDETLSQLDLSEYHQAAFVQKPFSPRDLAERVRNLLDSSSQAAPAG
jgi:DNA-binding response OmpR family regulator